MNNDEPRVSTAFRTRTGRLRRPLYIGLRACRGIAPAIPRFVELRREPDRVV